MMGEHGGSAFLVMYVFFVVAFGLPALMVECTLGRHTRRGPVGAFHAVSMPGATWWSLLLVLTIVMAGSYYGVVLAWVMRCTTSYGLAVVSGVAPQQFGLNDPWPVQLAYVFVTMAVSCGAVALGLRRGIERLSTLTLPVFFVLFVMLIVYVLRLDGAIDGLKAFLVPRPDRIRPSTAMAAMGQAFFSLGVSGTMMVVYGSYLRRDASIPAVAGCTAFADVAAAIMAGLIVVPAVLAFSSGLDQGPSLMFVTMPEVFGGMPAGNLVGAAFFGAILIVGLLSLIAAYEVVAIGAEDALGWRRRRTVSLLFVVQLVLSLPALLIADYIKYSDLIWGTTMMPLGSVLAILAVAWCLGRAAALEQLRRATRLPVPVFLFYWIKYVLPVGIVGMLVYGWIDALRDA